VMRPGLYEIPEKGVMQVEAYCDFAAERIAEAVEKAWNGRKPGCFTWGLGHASVGENRRATYADGHAEMYGNTNRTDFRGLEGHEDHDVGSMFFWNDAGKLIAVVVNVACPSQEVEHDLSINADYWHPVRESLHKRFGADVCILSWAGSAGDISPHLMYRKAAEERMRKLRNLSRLEELGRRVAAAVEETYQAVQNDRHCDVPLMHKTLTLKLPMRLVTDAEYNKLKAEVEAKKPAYRARRWYERVFERYERQKTDPHPTAETQIHVLRIGDVAVCTNPFELFTDYGVQIKARSKAAQTFVIQLAGEGVGGYLPTERAVKGGSYSAIVQSNQVGPEGGQVLVEETVKTINSFWK
jgi:hypothetical protein